MARLIFRYVHPQLGTRAFGIQRSEKDSLCLYGVNLNATWKTATHIFAALIYFNNFNLLGKIADVVVGGNFSKDIFN